jgi:serine/threonine-protein kinase
MGIIFRAYQVGLDREVALKVLSPSLQMKREFVDKFIGEAKMAASLSHPNLVHVHEIGQEGDRRYYSMELVEGTNLHELMKKEGRLPQERAIEITLQIAKALQAIHERGIVHRDVKPDNIILRKDGIPILVDLGLAIYTNQDHSDEKAMGNPYYIAPEMIEKPAEVDTRADIYSLGSTFYRMLSGQHAVEGDTPREIVKNLLRKKVTPLEEIDHTIGEDVAKICRRMMRHDLSKRYMAMEMVVQALDRLLFFH